MRYRPGTRAVARAEEIIGALARCAVPLVAMTICVAARAQQIPRQPAQPASEPARQQPRQLSGQQAVESQSLTLKQAVNMAIQNSRDLSLARLRYLVLQRETGVRRSRFLPNVYAGSGLAYSNGFPLVEGGGAPALFSLSYEEALLDLPGKGELRAGQQQAEQQQLEVQGVRDAVIVQTASAYLELAKVRRESDLLQKERDSARQILDFTQKRLDAGYELPVEVTKAQLTAARIEQRLAQLDDQDDSVSDQLRALLRMGPDQRIEVVAADIPAIANQEAGELVRQALTYSVVIKQAESEQIASEARLKGERGGYWPTISIIGQYNVLARFNNYDQFFNRFQRNNVIAGLDVKIPIFASHTSAAVAVAKANLTAAQATVENKRSQVSVDVRHKARQSREMDMNREVARLELSLAQDNLQVMQAQFQQGRISIRDLETGQLEENDKWLAFLDADFARQQAELDLLSTTGQVAALLQ